MMSKGRRPRLPGTAYKCAVGKIITSGISEIPLLPGDHPVQDITGSSGQNEKLKVLGSV